MLITKRGWKTIVFLDEQGEMTSRVCTDCQRLKLVNSFMADNKGLCGKRPDCIVCYNKKHRKTTAVRKHRSRAKMNGLPSDMTLEKFEKAKEEQGYKCILTGRKDRLTVEHFTSLVWGTGLGDTFKNIVYLDKGVNSSKGSKNPFSWIRTQSREVQLRFFNDLVPMLAKRNGLTPKEFEEYVNNEYAKYIEMRGE